MHSVGITEDEATRLAALLHGQPAFEGLHERLGGLLDGYRRAKMHNCYTCDLSCDGASECAGNEAGYNWFMEHMDDSEDKGANGDGVCDPNADGCPGWNVEV